MPSSVHIDSHPAWGGGQAQSLGLAMALASRGEPTWFIVQPGSALESRLRDSYLVTRGLGFTAPRASHLCWDAIPLRGPAGLRSVARLAGILARLRPDIVHVHESASHVVAGLAARRAARGPTEGRAPKIIATRRTERPLRTGWLGRAKYLLWCDRLICVSQAIRSRCLAAGLPESLLSVIPDFVDCRYFDPASEPVSPSCGDGPRILSVGRLTAEKGHRVLLDAMREVAEARPTARLLICGTGGEEAALRRQAAALGLGDRVEFLGLTDDIRRALARADVFVMPSIAEGLGVAALEAMAMARPVVASRVGGLCESVVHGETGLLVPEGDSHALAEALLELLNDPERAEAMGRAGRQRALSHYDRPHIVGQITDLYQQVVAKPA